MNLQTENTLAKIAVNKSLLKEFVSNNQRTVYLKDNSEFQIQIFNPYTYTIGADIYINGSKMSNRIVLKPGERIWLERYLNEARKFLFTTYEIENTSEAISATRNNGEVKLIFYKEQENNNIYIKSINWCDNNLYSSSFSSSINTYDASTTTLGLSDSASTYTSCSANIKGIDTSRGISKSIDTIETGRIEKGNYSSQKFQNININFDYWSFKTEVIKLLPISQKPITKNDLKKLYCYNCGHKVNTKFKYCPYCGTKI